MGLFATEYIAELCGPHLKVTCNAGDAVGRTPGAVGQLDVGAASVHGVAALVGKEVLTQGHSDTQLAAFSLRKAQETSQNSPLLKALFGQAVRPLQLLPEATDSDTMQASMQD